MSYAANQGSKNSIRQENLLPEKTDVERLEIVAEWAEVQYLSCEIRVYNNKIIKLDEFSQKIQNMASTKPNFYATEKSFTSISWQSWITK